MLTYSRNSLTLSLTAPKAFLHFCPVRPGLSERFSENSVLGFRARLPDCIETKNSSKMFPKSLQMYCGSLIYNVFPPQ